MSISKKYRKFHIEAVVRKVSTREISPYIIAEYDACRVHLPDDIDLVHFAAYHCNFNTNKCSPGEKAQLSALMAFDPQITKLPARGEGSIKLTKVGDTTRVVRSSEKSTIRGIKSFDAMREYEHMLRLFILKTIDLNPFTTNEGGGHQDNVQAEIGLMADAVRGKRLTFNGKPVQIVVVIDGRSNIAAAYANYNSTNFVVTNCDTFCNQQ
jgi:hypothetical protein